ncbi:MAG: phosphohistidine phosphatase SixA [Gammaproteobacteria bacterium]|nr:phosphohistidine phosphatase SixA [Gammaproteobacteria bacterium]
MKLILMRHAEAEPGDALHYPDDALRPLTAEGAKTQKKVAQALQRMGVMPQRIFTSPRLRARQTAEITAQVLGLNNALEESDALGDDCSPDSVLALLRDYADKEIILCVGHEPDLSELAGALLCSTYALRIKFVKSGVLGIRFEGEAGSGRGILCYFYRPRDLCALL